LITSLGITRDKKSLGYAVSSVDGDEISAVKNTNFLSSLQGKVAGLDIKNTGGFASGANVVIRGYSSLT
jgi:outer membrane cobalamin receptor